MCIRDQNITNRCYGAGGGGSGGVIYFNGAIPAVTTSTAAGSAGLELRIVGCGIPAHAVNGTDGSVIPNYSYRTSSIPSTSCSGALAVRIIYFNAFLVNNEKVKVEWDLSLIHI